MCSAASVALSCVALCGRERYTTIAAVAASAAPTVTAKWMPDTKACDAAVVTALASAGPSPRAASRAPANDDFVAACADAGMVEIALSIELLYRDAARLPRTATPSAAPSSRVQSFIADPVPARRAGTADMIDAVMGDIAMAMPLVSGTMQANTYQ